MLPSQERGTLLNTHRGDQGFQVGGFRCVEEGIRFADYISFSWDISKLGAGRG